MKLEFANGTELEVSNPGELEKELDTLGSGNDFAILTEGDSFIQTSYSGGSFLFQYSEAGTMHESTETDAGIDKVKQVFSKYLTGDSSWKNQFHWENAGEVNVSHDSRSSANLFQSGRSGSGTMKDELIDTAKRSVVNWIKRKIR